MEDAGPQLLGLRPVETLPADARGLVAGATDLTRVVGRQEQADDKVARLDGPDVGSDLDDRARVLVAHRLGPWVLIDGPPRPLGGDEEGTRGGPRGALTRTGPVEPAAGRARFGPDGRRCFSATNPPGQAIRLG